MTPDEAQQHLETVAAQLGEHFEAHDSAAALSRVIPQPQPPREDGDEWKD